MNWNPKTDFFLLCLVFRVQFKTALFSIFYMSATFLYYCSHLVSFALRLHFSPLIWFLDNNLFFLYPSTYCNSLLFCQNLFFFAANRFYPLKSNVFQGEDKYIEPDKIHSTPEEKMNSQMFVNHLKKILLIKVALSFS